MGVKANDVAFSDIGVGLLVACSFPVAERPTKIGVPSLLEGLTGSALKQNEGSVKSDG